MQHVPSDIGADEKYLPPESFATQNHLNYISNWTKENKMKLNEAKSNYLVFSRSKENLSYTVGWGVDIRGFDMVKKL